MFIARARHIGLAASLALTTVIAASPVASADPVPVGDIVDRIIVTFDNSPVSTAALNAATTSTDLQYVGSSADKTRAYALTSDTDINKVAAQLESVPGVASVTQDTRVTVDSLTSPDDTYYNSTNQWSLFGNFGVNAAGAWTQGVFGERASGTAVTVAVLDTGIIPTHPDLQGRLLPGYDFVSADGVLDFTTAMDGDGRDDDPTDPGDTCSSSRPTWHGTHVTGIIAANSNNAIGVAGVAPKVKVLPVRVLGCGGGYMSDVADGIRWAAGIDVEPGVIPVNPNPANVINLSLGGPYACSVQPDLQAAINQAVALGVLVVAAAGNSNIDAKDVSPASCQNVVTVAATDSDGLRGANSNGPFSNFGADTVDIAAPGVNILSTVKPDSVFTLLDFNQLCANIPSAYCYMSGTSQAAPHVAAVAALVFSVSADITAADVELILDSSATDFPTLDPNDYPEEFDFTTIDCTLVCGSGIVNASEAVKTALTLFPPDNGGGGGTDNDFDNDGFDSDLLGGTDCNDNNADINPDATEIENGIDDNCNGQIDEGFGGGGGGGTDNDFDNDGFDSDLLGGTDCDDNDADVYPGATEIENGIDDNCDGQIDEGFGGGGGGGPTPIVPDPPTDLAVEGDRTGVVVSWFAPAYSGDYAVDTYDVRMTDSSEVTTQVCSKADDPTNQTGAYSCTVTTVTLGETYEFTVYAVSEAGSSDPAEPVSYSHIVSPAEVKNASRVRSYNNSITVSWDQLTTLTETGGVSASDVQYTVTAMPEDQGGVLSLSIPRPVRMRVLAVDGFGVNAFEADDDFDGWMTPVDCDDSDPNVNPGAPEIPDNLVDDNCDGQIDEATDGGGGDTGNGDYTCMPEFTEPDGGLFSLSAPTKLECTIYELPLGTTFLLTITATSTYGESETNVTKITIPSTLAKPSIQPTTSITHNSAKITWKLDLVTSLDADSYVVSLKPDGTGATRSQTLTIDDENANLDISKKCTRSATTQTCSVVFTGLITFKGYTITVRAATGEIYGPDNEVDEDGFTIPDTFTSVSSSTNSRFSTTYIQKSEKRGPKSVRLNSRSAATTLISGLPSSGTRKWSTSGSCKLSSATATKPTLTAPKSKGSCNLIVVITNTATKTQTTYSMVVNFK